MIVSLDSQIRVPNTIGLRWTKLLTPLIGSGSWAEEAYASSREGRATVAEPGVVFSPSPFSSQISQSA